MPVDRLEQALSSELAALDEAGVRKRDESVISEILPPRGVHGPRVILRGEGDRSFLRMNSNGYLGLANHPAVIAAEETAARRYGAGPGAVRFISGTFEPHVELEHALAREVGRRTTGQDLLVPAAPQHLLCVAADPVPDGLERARLATAVNLDRGADHSPGVRDEVGHREEVHATLGPILRLPDHRDRGPPPEVRREPVPVGGRDVAVVTGDLGQDHRPLTRFCRVRGGLFGLGRCYRVGFR